METLLPVLMYLVASGFCVAAVALVTQFFQVKHAGLLLGAIAYGAGGLGAIVLSSWWPLAGGYALSFVLSRLGADLPTDIPSRLVNHAIGGELFMRNFFRGLECEGAILKMELTFFVISVVTVAYLMVSRDDRPGETLDKFTEAMLRRTLKETQSPDTFALVITKYRERFSEYESLLMVMLNPDAPTEPDPTITFLMRAYERITNSSVTTDANLENQIMIKIMLNGDIAWKFVASNLDFVRGLKR